MKDEELDLKKSYKEIKIFEEHAHGSLIERAVILKRENASIWASPVASAVKNPPAMQEV